MSTGIDTQIMYVCVPNCFTGCACYRAEWCWQMSLLHPPNLRTQWVTSRYLWDFTEESSSEKAQRNTERIQIQAHRVLTNRLQFPAGRSMVCGCQRASPLPFRCCVISWQQACMAGGLELTNLNKRSVGLWNPNCAGKHLSKLAGD